jgi:hypothetical protein
MWRRNERPSTFDGSTALGEKRRAREARSARDEGPTNASPKLVRYIQCHYCCWQVGHSAVSSVLCNDPQEMYLKERSSVYVARDPWLDTQTPNCGYWTSKSGEAILHIVACGIGLRPSWFGPCSCGTSDSHRCRKTISDTGRCDSSRYHSNQVSFRDTPDITVFKL